MSIFNNYIWETHGIHAGTGDDHVKHGVDELDKITEKAIEMGHPSISFIIHSPRLTNFRYESETKTDIKFIRGNAAYLTYPEKIKKLKEQYSDKINIKYGVELEWLGSEIGLQWNRSQIFQAEEVDFVVGSVHFSKEKIPYDGSKQEAQTLLKLRGGLDNYWMGYLNEVIEMIECSSDMFQVVGHLDLPKLNVDIPQAILNFETDASPLADKMRWVLELISVKNLALDVNLAGIKKGCGIYPMPAILRRAKQLHIPIAIGTDTHLLHHYADNFEKGLQYVLDNGYKQYVSFSRLIPETRTIFNNHLLKMKYTLLNKAIELLNQRMAVDKQKAIPELAFGNAFHEFLDIYPNSTNLGGLNAIRVRKGGKSITFSGEMPKFPNKEVKGLFSKHLDKPGVLSMIFNTLASERINIETAFLKSNNDGTAVAFLTIEDPENRVDEAIAFIKGTKNEVFKEITFNTLQNISDYYLPGNYLLAVDGVDLTLALSQKIIITKHNNAPGVLLILLSALASKQINIIDMQLAHKNKIAYAALAIEGDSFIIKDLLTKLGSNYSEASYIEFHSI